MTRELDMGLLLLLVRKLVGLTQAELVAVVDEPYVNSTVRLAPGAVSGVESGYIEPSESYVCAVLVACRPLARGRRAAFDRLSALMGEPLVVPPTRDEVQAQRVEQARAEIEDTRKWREGLEEERAKLTQEERRAREVSKMSPMVRAAYEKHLASGGN